MPTAKKNVRSKPQRARKGFLVGTCGHCGSKVFDGVPMTCCVSGVLGYLSAVMDHAKSVK